MKGLNIATNGQPYEIASKSKDPDSIPYFAALSVIPHSAFDRHPNFVNLLERTSSQAVVHDSLVWFCEHSNCLFVCFNST